MNRELIGYGLFFCAVLQLVVLEMAFWAFGSFCGGPLWGSVEFHNLWIRLSGATLLPLMDALRYGSKIQALIAMPMTLFALAVLGFNLGQVHLLGACHILSTH